MSSSSLTPIFDKKKEQTLLAEVQKISEIGSQMSDVNAKRNLNPMEAQITATGLRLAKRGRAFLG